MTAITAAATLAAAPLLAGSVATALTPLLQRRRVPDATVHTIGTDSPTNTDPSTDSHRQITGLLIHSVYEKARFNLSGISKNTFGAILDCLKNNNVGTITVSRHTAPHTAPTTAITFDDGLRSFYDNAYPLLEERGVKSTLFPIAGLIGKQGDWDVIGKTEHLTATMLREIADSGHEIGSHSLTHANLVWLGDDDLIKELRESKSILEDITGTAVKSLSFPFGSWNKRVWEAARSVGYEYATAYRGHRNAPPEWMPVFGVYRFDSAVDAVNRTVGAAAATPTTPLSILSLSSTTSKAFASLMSHFCKGTPLVKFRKTYRLSPQTAPLNRTYA